ncbi:hypothetical protein EJB05_40936, partial [Eragrostis curvula]
MPRSSSPRAAAVGEPSIQTPQPQVAQHRWALDLVDPPLLFLEFEYHSHTIYVSIILLPDSLLGQPSVEIIKNRRMRDESMKGLV